MQITISILNASIYANWKQQLRCFGRASERKNERTNKRANEWVYSKLLFIAFFSYWNWRCNKERVRWMVLSSDKQLEKYSNKKKMMLMCCSLWRRCRTVKFNRLCWNASKYGGSGFGPYLLQQYFLRFYSIVFLVISVFINHKAQSVFIHSIWSSGKLLNCYFELIRSNLYEASLFLLFL